MLPKGGQHGETKARSMRWQKLYMATVLGGYDSPLRGMSAAQESVCRKASETFHLLVDGGQQLRQDHIQFVAGGLAHLIAEASDSVIEAARRH